MQTNYPLFRLDARLLQLLIGEDQIIMFRTVNALILFGGIVVFCFGSIYGTYLLIGASQSTISLFNSSLVFRAATLLFAIGFPWFATWLLIYTAKQKLSKIKSAEEISNFLKKRRGNVRISWDEIATASRNGSRIVFNLKKGGFRAGWIRQIYLFEGQTFEVESPASELLTKLLEEKLGPGFEEKK
ncbi:MAG TPA: hypothetical protein VJN71_07370 [Nitrososphaerales archaeon]|nr:hypothetical protein [Nitrososphaerales archaeon]